MTGEERKARAVLEWIDTFRPWRPPPVDEKAVALARLGFPEHAQELRNQAARMAEARGWAERLAWTEAQAVEHAGIAARSVVLVSACPVRPHTEGWEALAEEASRLAERDIRESARKLRERLAEMDA